MTFPPVHSLVDVLFIPTILVGVLAKVSVISQLYLAFFVVYVFFPPLFAEKTIDAPARRVNVRFWFWTAMISFSSLVAFIHAIFQILLAANVQLDSETWGIFGFQRLDSFSVALKTIFIDIGLLVVAVVSAIYSKKLTREEHVFRLFSHLIPLGHSRFDYPCTLLLSIVAGILSPSALNVILISAATFIIVSWAIFSQPSQKRKSSHWIIFFESISTPFLFVCLLFCFLHLMLLSLTRFPAAQSQIGKVVSEVLGLFNSMDNGGEFALKIASFTIEALLLFMLGNIFAANYSHFGSDFGDLEEHLNPQEVHPEPDDIIFSSKPFLQKYFFSPFLNHGRLISSFVLLLVFLLVPSGIYLIALIALLTAFTCPDRIFALMAPFLLAYLWASFVLQFVSQIPHVFDSSEEIEQWGLKKQNIPSLFLLLQLIPVLCLSVYCFVMSSFSQIRSSLLQSTIRNYYVGVREAISNSNVEETTDNGDTVLHIACRFGFDYILKILLQEDKIKSLMYVRNNDGKLPYDMALEQEQLSSISLLVQAGFEAAEFDLSKETSFFSRFLFQGYFFLSSLFLSFGSYVLLLLLYIASLLKVDLIHLGYFILFLIFFSIPRIVQSSWIYLVLYAEFAFILLYSFHVFKPDAADWDGTWLDTVGFVNIDLFPSAIIVVIAVLQLNLFRDVKRFRSMENDFDNADFFGLKRISDSFGEFVAYSFRKNGIFLVYLCLVVVSLSNSADVFQAGYLIAFVICMLIHGFFSDARVVLKGFWFLLVAYSAIVLFAQYAFQFEFISDWVYRIYDENGSVTLRQIGLKTVDNGRDLVILLIPPTIVLVLSVFQFRSFWSDSVRPLDITQEGNLYLAIFNLANRSLDLFFRTLALQVLVTIAACASLFATNLLSFLYLASLLSLLPFQRASMRLWVPLSLISSIEVIAKFLFQILGPEGERTQGYTRFIGFRIFEGSYVAFDAFFGDIMVLVFSVLLEHYSRSFKESSMLVVENKADSISKEKNLDIHLSEDVSKDQEECIRKDSSLERLEYHCFAIFALSVQFCKENGLEISILILLISSFVRNNVLSLIYVLFFVGLYSFQYFDALRFYWGLLLLILCVSIAFQYLVSLDFPNSLKMSISLRPLSNNIAQWLMLHSIDTATLLWDFFAFFSACLYRHEMLLLAQIPQYADYSQRSVTYGMKDSLKFKFVSSTALQTAKVTVIEWSDKLIIVLLFITTSFDTNIVDLIYLLFASYYLYKIPNNPIFFFESLRKLNFAIVSIFFFCLVPYSSRSGERNSLWESLSGFSTYQSASSTATQFIEYVAVFILIDIQLKIFASKAYKRIQANRLDSYVFSKDKALILAEKFKNDKINTVQENEQSRIRFLWRLWILFENKDLIRDSENWDKEVWPTEPGENFVSSQEIDESIFEQLPREKFLEEEVEKDISKRTWAQWVDLWVRYAKGLIYSSIPPEFRLNGNQIEIINDEDPGEMTFWYLLLNWIAGNSYAFVIFAFLLNYFVSPNILTAFIAVSILACAIFEDPRVSRSFLLLAFVWTCCKICIQFTFQFKVFCYTIEDGFFVDPSLINCFSVSNNDDVFRSDFVVGIRKVDSFASYILLDVLCLITLYWHRSSSKSVGLWFASERRILSVSGSEWQTIPDLESVIARGAPFLVLTIHRMLSFAPSFVRRYFYSIVPCNIDGTINHKIKSGRAYYSWIFFVEMIALFTATVGWASMTAVSGESVSQALSTNRISGEMVIFVFIQIMIIVLDRVVYLYASLWSKLFLQYATLLYFHIFVFVYCPSKSDERYSHSGTLMFFFFLKLVYFVLSGLQIRAGFPEFEESHHFLTRTASQTRSLIFKIYRAIPFLYELRSLLDWMCTVTSLDLWESLKLEDIYANLYIVKCDLLYKRSHRRGAPQPGYRKFFSGTLIFMLLMTLILLPLLLFSSANPAEKVNKVEIASVSMEIILGTGEYALFDISVLITKDPVPKSTYNFLLRENRITSDQPLRSVQNITMSPYADTFWSISSPNLQLLVNRLNSSDTSPLFRMIVSFTRDGPSGNRQISDQIEWPISPEDRIELVNALSSADEEGTVNISSIPKILRLPASGNIITEAGFESTYILRYMEDSGGNVYWSLSNSIDDSRGVEFITISDPYFDNFLFGASSAATAGIVTLYVTVVLTAGRFLRMFVSDQVQRIIYQDLHNVDDLLKLTEGVFIARKSRDLLREETMYRNLVRIYRSPEMLIQLTRRRKLHVE